MLPYRLSLILIVALILFFSLVMLLLKHKKLALKYTLLWLLTGFLMIIIVLRPGILYKLAALAGVQSGMNVLYFFLLAFVIIILMSLTSICSGQNARIRELIQTEAIVEKRLRETEKKVKELSKMLKSEGCIIEDTDQ